MTFLLFLRSRTISEQKAYCCDTVGILKMFSDQNDGALDLKFDCNCCVILLCCSNVGTISDFVHKLLLSERQCTVVNHGFWNLYSKDGQFHPSSWSGAGLSRFSIPVEWHIVSMKRMWSPDPHAGFWGSNFKGWKGE